MNTAQNLQEEQYQFPYHYIPNFRNGFVGHKYWGWGLNYIAATELILETIDKYNFNSILDVGTGDGRLVHELKKSFPDRKITGVDYSQKAIALAKALNPSLDFIARDVVSQPLQDKYDAITLIEVFEHIPIENCKDFVKALIQHLNPGGLLHITVPHENLPLRRRHFQHFNYKTLVEYFNVDFSLEKVCFLDKQSPWVRIINTILYNRFFVLNEYHIRNWLYTIYKQRFLLTDEKYCQRIYLVLRLK